MALAKKNPLVVPSVVTGGAINATNFTHLSPRELTGLGIHFYAPDPLDAPTVQTNVYRYAAPAGPVTQAGEASHLLRFAVHCRGLKNVLPVRVCFIQLGSGSLYRISSDL
eukprot:670213-Prorocentrum_minimum.AAC.1